MAVISGIFTDPFGVPLANVTISLVARSTTSATFSGTNAAAVTGEDGSYSMSVLVGTYAVTAIIGRQQDYLGIIQVYPDSQDGTLNDYLTNFNPDDVTPDIIAEMVLLAGAAIEAAKSAESSAEIAAKYAVVPRGEYDPAISYSTNDIVEFDGSEYRATADTTGVSPPAYPWELFLSAGEPGEQGKPGEQGDPGPANVLTIGDVTTLDPGEPATASITGESPEQVLNLAIPQGAPGESVITVPDSWDSPGSYVFGYLFVTEDDAAREPGDEVSASDIYVGEVFFKSVGSTDTSGASYTKTPRGGTWRLQGNSSQGVSGGNIKSCLVFIRIDGVTASMSASVMNGIALGTTSIRNCRYSSQDNSVIECEFLANGVWHPFTASPNDPARWGREIYAAAVADELGDITPFSG
ncbi:hypothetical protein FNI11_13530 [Salmonella enterica subsp. salamae]|nr:hypothetical protein [Salmonella enterica subsp. salamae]ECJ2281373.1 hypothetical protein [Salmonella enterica subsp. salamae]